MTDRYGYGYGEDDPPGSRRGPGVTGQRADEADPPERPADVREIDLTEDDLDDQREDAEQVERLRKAAREEDGEGGVLEARSPFQFGPPVGARQDDEDEDEEEDQDHAAAEAVATVDISTPPGDGDQAAAMADDEDRADAAEPATATAGAGPAGVTLAPATAPPRPETAEEATAAAGVPGAGSAVAPAGATPALRSGALLATDAEAIRRQFIDIQAGFVDEPRQAVEQAGELVEGLHRKVMESLQAERAQLGGALDGEDPSTEDLRQALRAYRAYVDRLLGLSL